MAATCGNFMSEKFFYTGLIVKGYCLQAIIMILALLIPSFKHFVELFQDTNAIEMSEAAYGGFRNLAISSSQFYSLSAGFALAFLINVYLILVKRHKGYYFSLILIFIGGIFSGRTFFLGVGLGFILYLYNLKDISRYFKFFLGAFVLLIILILLPQSVYNAILPKEVRDWAFEFIYNYQTTGSFTTKSSNQLINQMYFWPKENTFLFGDAIWSNPNGSYYKGTDAGYMRMILYYGVSGILFFFLYNLYLIKIPFKIRSRFNSIRLEKSMFILLLFYILILNIKGQSMGYGLSTQCIFIIIFVEAVLVDSKLNYFEYEK